MSFILVLSLALALSVHEVNAQAGSGSVTVNIMFRPVQTIAVSTDQHSIDLTYATTDDHQRGVSVERDDHLTIFSTGGFTVTVEASSDYLTRLGGTETIPVSDISLKASSGTGNETNSSYSEVALSSSPTPLIESDNGGRDLKYNVIYDNSVAGGNNQYVNRFVSDDGDVTTYRSRITYTITTR